MIATIMRIILIHGFNASPEQNFHPWLSQRLREAGHEVLTPTLPLRSDTELNLPEVVESLRHQVGLLKNNDILLGHSLGALMILHYLEAVEMTETPRAVVLVGAPWKVLRPELRRLFFVDLDAEVLMWKAREFVVVHSSDDALVPLEHGKKLASSLKATFVETDQCDHFMGAEYPILFDTLQKIVVTPFEYSPGMSLSDDYAP